MQKKFSTQNRKQLQAFSQMMRMKFKPQSNAPTTAIVQKNKQLIEKSKLNPENQLSKATISRMTNQDKKLKYLHLLSPEHFLVGNQNQIDLIVILGITHSFVDTDYCWSLTVATGIDLLAVEPRKSLIAVVSSTKLTLYKFNLKKCKDKPQLIKEFDIKPQSKYIHFLKDSLLALFYEKQFEIYNVEEQKKIYKKCMKPYNEPKNFTLFAVPQVVENTLKVFFIEEELQYPTFGLWFIKINIELATIQVQKPQKVYEVKKTLRKQLIIQNYSKDIIFMNIGTEILAAKNGYILDSVKLNFQIGHPKLRYISNQRLIHISDTKLEIYKMTILTTVVPNRIHVMPVDALQIKDKPNEAEFFGILSTIGDNFAVFYQNISHFNVFTKGQATYWFMVTEPMGLQQKIRRIFNYGTQITKIDPQILQEKCDMARKMGLNQKELYLQIWNRSSKSSIEDYQFILATRNYKTIHSQIEKKLKKESMSFRELLKIEECCMVILRDKLYGTKCKQENIQEYLASHCFIKKLKLFMDIELHKKKTRRSLINDWEFQQQDKLLINIQQYYEYKDFDIKNYLVEKIVDFCVFDKGTKGVQIRMMLRAFKFVYRVIYKVVLEEIIRQCKGKLVVLLKHIPEILPYSAKLQGEFQVSQEATLYEGIWNDIKDYEWERNLFVENFTTIDNKEVVADLINSIWYRRYWLTAHQFINLRKEQILRINRQNNSDLIFYYFISKIFDLVSDSQTQYQIIYFLQQTYTTIPQHLRGKIFLHVNLHKFYLDNYKKAKLRYLSLDEFLKFDDAQLFAYYFQQEKHTKNCILMFIKKIYEETCEQGQGLNLFNQGLLAYFKSPKSQISDLKYLLNRMNNQKTQFHQANLSTYQVLIRAMEYKLTLGSDQDIPIDEVLIYIENIPISKGNEIMEQLSIVEKINEQADRFKKMKLNMTIKEIIDNFQDVIARVVEYQFQVNKIKSLKNEKDITQRTYKILAEVQVVREKIYGNQRNPGLPFFIYLTKLLQQTELIKFAKNLLTNEFITKYYPVDLLMTENLVVYMYKWALSKKAAFLKNFDYFKELMTLLPQDNDTRKFIQNETAFAIALSAQNSPLLYPISDEQYPGLFQLSDVLKQLPIQHIVKVDIDFIYTCIKEMQQITIRWSYSQDQMGYINVENITLHEVSSVFILKIIEENHLNDAIPVINKVIAYEVPNKRYNMIFFALLIQKLSPELNDEGKNVFIKVISYCYDEPEIMFEFIEYYFHSQETALMKSVKLRKKLDAYIEGKLNYNKDNILFSAQTKALLANPQSQHKFKSIVQENCKNLRMTKPQFQTIQLDIIYSIICNEPYLAAKFVQANQHQLNFKVLRAYLSYFVGNPLFDEKNFIDYCKRVFSMVLQSNIKRIDISRIIFHEEKFHFNYAEIRHIGIQDEIDKKHQKTYKNFEKKKTSLLNVPLKKSTCTDKPLSQNQNVLSYIPQELSSHTPSEYPFSDSDDDNAEQQQVVPSKAGIKKRSKIVQNSFNSKDQRAKLMGRKNSVFGQKSSNTLAKSMGSLDANGSQELVSNYNLSKKLSQKPQVKKPLKIYVKRTLTNQVLINGEKKNVQAISQKDESSLSQSKIKKTQKLEKLERFQKKQSLVFGGSGQNIENSRMSKHESQYSMNQISEVQQEDPIFRIKKLLVHNYDMIGDKIDFEPLLRQESQEDFSGYLKEVVIKIYTDKALDNRQKLRLIRLTCQKYAKIPVNLIYLTVYENIQKIQEKYVIDLPIDRLLPVQGLFLSSKSFDDLFKLILPQIVQISTDQTIYKLSKLISLGFRKNIYETQISFQYIKKMITQFAEGHSQVQLNIRFDIIKSLLSKMSIMVLKERAPKLVQGIIANPALLEQIKNAVVQSVKKRGDNNGANQIKKLIEK